MKRILVVDDEIQILNALSRVFLETDYEVLTAESSNEALKLIETERIDLVICDMRIPLMDGYELLSIVKEKYPNIIRIILSGYAEEKSMFKALLHNVAKLYIFKPWNNDELLKNVEKLFADDNILMSPELSQLINDVGCHADIPDNCNCMITMIENEDSDGLIDALEKDEAMSALLIQVAKSSIYGVMPNSVKQAANYIGLHNLKCFMHWACIVLSDRQTYHVENEPELLWKHAYLTNRIFLFLYEAFLHKQPPESTLFAGLLHNIGLILIHNSLSETDKNLKDIDADQMLDLGLKEYKQHHQEIGAYFLNQWDLPFYMYEVALYHHRPLDPDIIHMELVSAVHIALYYAWKVLNGSKREEIDSKVFENIGIEKEEFELKLARYLK